MNLLADLTVWQTIVCALFLITCLLLIVVVLLQKGRGGGLSGAFGGVGGHSAFGAKTGDVFTWVTVGLTFAFIVIACIGNYVFVAPPSKAPTADVENASPKDAGQPGTTRRRTRRPRPSNC